MIREGRPDDLPRITHVRTSVIENHLSVEGMAARGITQQRIAADMEAGFLGCWVAEAAGEIVAFSMADNRDANIWALFTLPGFEGQGYGSGLLERSENWLKAQGFDRIFLETDKTARAPEFYTRHGWAEIPGAASDPEDMRMAKSI